MNAERGKVAVVTGAGGGMGRAISERLVRAGMKVAALDVNRQGAESTVEAIRDRGGLGEAFTVDLRDHESVCAAIDGVVERLGEPTVLVNKAGVWDTSSLFVDSDPADWDRILDTNIKGTLNCTHAVLPHMIEQGIGTVINIASVAGVCGLPRMVHYSASKGAVIAMTKALALELAEHDIIVNCISPGSIDIGKGGTPATLLQRLGGPDDVAELVGYLASPVARFITGENIIVDGGRVLATRWPDRNQ